MGKGNIYLVDLGTGNNMNLLPLAIAMVGSYSASQDDLKELYNIEYRFLRHSHETMDTKTIHRAVPITTRGYVRKAVQFRVNEGYIDGQEQIVNASFFDLKEKPRLTYYFKFGITPTSQNSEVDDNHIPLTVFLKRSAKIILNKTKAYFR